jgi:hypothetical protein
VRRALDDPAPGEVEQAVGPRFAVERLERLGVAGQGPFGTRECRLQVDARRGRAHQEVGTGAGAELPPPARQLPAAVSAREVVGERRQLDRGADLLDEVGELRQRLHVVGPIHRKHRVVPEELAERLVYGAEPVSESAGDVEQRRPVSVAVRKVLGAHRRAVRRLPFESVRVDRGGHPAPDHRLVDPGQPEDLGHLRDVAEHVRQVADPHRAAELLAAPKSLLQVADDRLARDEELVHQHLPGADREPPLLDEPPDPRLSLGPDLEVVVEGRELAVEGEAVALVGVHQVEQPIDQTDELQPEALEGEVPLPVPVRVGDDVYGGTQAAGLYSKGCA